MGLNFGEGAGADDGAEQDVVGVGCRGQALGSGPREDGGEEGELVGLD